MAQSSLHEECGFKISLLSAGTSTPEETESNGSTVPWGVSRRMASTAFLPPRPPPAPAAGHSLPRSLWLQQQQRATRLPPQHQLRLPLRRLGACSRIAPHPRARTTATATPSRSWPTCAALQRPHPAGGPAPAAGRRRGCAAGARGAGPERARGRPARCSITGSSRRRHPPARCGSGEPARHSGGRCRLAASPAPAATTAA